MDHGVERVRVEVLGPLRVVRSDGADVTPEGVLQRRLLAYLVLRRGHVVSADTAVDVLWPADPPGDPAGALQNHLSRLRRGLPAGLIESVGGGYRLEPAGIELDADLLAGALAGGPDATGEVDAVLARWQGPAYPELDEVDDGRAEAGRLEELRLRAQELRAEQRLALGDTDGLVAELTVLIAEEPLRERPRSLLMSALAATGRSAEALRVYDEFRRLLGDELGAEPSPALAAQHLEVLTGAAATSWRPATRLPNPLSSLVGRDRLAVAVVDLVAGQRLVTLVGPGGVGKTRLLVEVGHRLRAADPERPVVLCELASSDATSAVDAVASALGVDARPGVPITDRIVAVVGDAEIVVLLDNCEHVLEPTAALVERLLAACPGVTVVATSRERVRLPGEQVCVVPTLPAEDVAGPAVQLFLERARAVAPGFDPAGGELDRVTEVVRRLDGLPLAIELAAARLHTHDIEEVAAGIRQRYALLDAGSRTSSRHASLWAAASWSFAMLDDDLRRTFADVSVFAGSFPAAAAAEVCGLDEAEAGAVLAQLVERSLVMRAPGRRFVLLETLRAFAAEQLAADGRDAVVGERHVRHVLDFLEDARRRMLDPGASVVAEIDTALPDLRTALAWLLDHGRVESAGHLVSLLKDYGLLRLRPDVLAWSERVAEADPEDQSPWASRVWGVAAYAAWMAGSVPETGVRAARAIEVAEAAGELHAEVAVIQGSAALFMGRLADAAAWYRRGVERAGADLNQRLFAAASELLALGYAGEPIAAERADALLAEVGDAATPYGAYAWYCAGEADVIVDPERARERLEQAIALAEVTGAPFVAGVARATVASLDARSGDPEVAARDYRQLLTDWQQAGMRSTQWTLLRTIAALLDRLGRHRDAAVLEGAVRASATGHHIFGADAVALDELSARLRAELGDEAYGAARAEGADLDDDAVVAHALRAL